VGINSAEDEAWMRHAIRLAQRAEEQGEVPVGAVIVHQGRCVAEGWNRPIIDSDPTAHAEIMALRQAGQALNNYRLIDCSLYVTLEPCMMCMGAISHARIKRLVFGALDAKRGAVCSALSLESMDFLNHKMSWQGELLAETCSDLLRDFFRGKRQQHSIKT